MPNPRKRKGQSFEQKLVKMFEALGWRARRQPYSGALQDFPHDLQVEHPVIGALIVEAKHYAKPPSTFNKWLGQGDMLVVKGDYQEPFVYMSWSVFESLMKVQEEKNAKPE